MPIGFHSIGKTSVGDPSLDVFATIGSTESATAFSISTTVEVPTIFTGTSLTSTVDIQSEIQVNCTFALTSETSTPDFQGTISVQTSIFDVSDTIDTSVITYSISVPTTLGSTEQADVLAFSCNADIIGTIAATGGVTTADVQGAITCTTTLSNTGAIDVLSVYADFYIIIGGTLNSTETADSCVTITTVNTVSTLDASSNATVATIAGSISVATSFAVNDEDAMCMLAVVADIEVSAVVVSIEAADVLRFQDSADRYFLSVYKDDTWIQTSDVYINIAGNWYGGPDVILLMTGRTIHMGSITPVSQGVRFAWSSTQVISWDTLTPVRIS